MSRARPMLCAGLFLATVMTTSSAAARTVTVEDGRDRPAAADITSAVYRNKPARVVATVDVRDLATGRLVVRVGPPDSDVIYNATIRARADGTVTRRLAYVTNISRDPVPCAYTADWSAERDRVRVVLPHRCLDFGRFLSREWVQATLTARGTSDAAAGRDVGRGDSPGCATDAEMRNVERGLTRVRVHRLLDTGGRFGDGAAGGYSRVYASCGGGRAWYVEYHGDTDRVVGKGRVG